MKPAIIPGNLAGKQLFDFLVKNESIIFHAKKSAIKYADEVSAARLFVTDKGTIVTKEEITQQQIDPNRLKLAVVINTTNWFDSHDDVHIPGLWKKTLSDNKKSGYYLLKMHLRGFEDVIGESLSGSAKTMAWKDLGIDLEGTTEALIFTGIIEKDRNPYMFDQYKKGYVKKHSVGMRYVKMVTCINDDDYPVQKENWDKYIEYVANREEAEKEGYFWAILEAQIVEGSAVLFASNTNTPTMEVSECDDNSTKNEPPLSTHEEPDKSKSFTAWLNKTTLIKN